ncbi:MAG: Polyribonucleotide nucleotidyltransferase [Anaerolineales bacterium]|nr:Polyribonucleotide nucleotidyltransferase [Anaerolineales bacterium]
METTMQGLVGDDLAEIALTDKKVHRYSTTIAGKEFVLETGKLAGQAGGAVTVQLGDTIVLVTATASQEPRDISFLPLSIDLEERLYAAGRIPGGFFRREGRPSESAILVDRLIDRPLRPLFPKGWDYETQIIITTLSSDGENFLDIPALIGSSAALMISDIPFPEPIAIVRVGMIDDELIINPTTDELEESQLDLRVAGTADAIIMVECGADEVSEDVMLEAIKLGHDAMQPIIALQARMADEVGKPKREVPPVESEDDVQQALADRLGSRLGEVVAETTTKEERGEALDALRDELVDAFAEEDEGLDPSVDGFEPDKIKSAFNDLLKEEVRETILERGERPDGRGSRDVRPIAVEVELSPRAHGSGLFSRGETQVLSIATLGTIGEEQRLDTLRPEESKRYIHHYNFPPFSTGETWFLRSPKRREIGHGALAETALRPMIPSAEDFPYTLRVVSEALSSNGSTSMASVCASTLALMDAGVPIHKPVSGIAMGLVTDPDTDRYRILTDIQGMEDHLGDMDFKVAGTSEGINALQMDIKIKGISYEVMAEALEQAREARLFILDQMTSVIAEPREEMSPYAPRITTVKIDPEKIGKVIGPGGKMIRAITEETDTKIDIEDDGTIFIAATEGPAAEAAIEWINELTAEPEVGKVYKGKVVRTTGFGAFVEIIPGTDGMVHISQLSDHHVKSVEDVVRVGDEILVMITNIDREGKIRLSRQAILEGWDLETAREMDRPGGGRSRR